MTDSFINAITNHYSTLIVVVIKYVHRFLDSIHNALWIWIICTAFLIEFADIIRETCISYLRCYDQSNSISLILIEEF